MTNSRYRRYLELRENMLRPAEAVLHSMNASAAWLKRFRAEQDAFLKRSRAAKRGWKKRHAR